MHVTVNVPAADVMAVVGYDAKLINADMHAPELAVVVQVAMGSASVTAEPALAVTV